MEENTIVGVGTGSTANHFIDALGSIKHKIDGAVSSSEASTEKLKALGIPVYDLNSVDEVAVYVDGADEIDNAFCMIKGGGAALTREKIVAAVAKKFVCIVDEKQIGWHTRAISTAGRSYSNGTRSRCTTVTRSGGDPVYREGVKTDNGNIIIDVHSLQISQPMAWEEK